MSFWDDLTGVVSAFMKNPRFSITLTLPTFWTNPKKEIPMLPDVPDRRREFIEALSPLAHAIETLLGISWLLCVTQAAHESDFGRSGLSVRAKNLFGITGDSWKKQGLPIIEMPTQEYVDGKPVDMTRPFRLYWNYGESILDWARLMAFSYPRAVAAARSGDSTGFFSELQKGGYATDPKYAEQLTGVLEVVRSLTGGRNP